MELEEIGINAGNWVDSAQGRRTFVNATLNLRVAISQFIKYYRIMVRSKLNKKASSVSE